MNVRGLADPIKRKDVFNWLRQKKYTLYCLQDIHLDNKNRSSFEKDWGSEIIYSSKSSESRGVAVLFPEHVNYSIKKTEKDENGNLIIIDLELNNLAFTLCVLYGPNKDNPEFYNNLKQLILKRDNCPLVICGDWNLVLNHNLDTYGYVRENNLNAKKCVTSMMEELELIDTWRSENNSKKKYTWVSSKSPIKMARLDFFLVTPDIHAQIKKHTIGIGYRSDHSLIGIEIDTSETPRGKGFWKFNASLLRDSNYIQAVQNEIAQVVKDYTQYNAKNEPQLITSKQMFWEVLKLRIRGMSIPYSTARKKKLIQDEREKEQKLKELNDELCLINNNKQVIINEMEKLKSDLIEIRESRIRGSLLKAKAREYCDFEKPTKFFCNLEKRNNINKTVNRIKVKDETITDPKKILEELKNFYKHLLTSKIHN